ncbi:protein-disulfide reductase DsbD N-terminal domain-containing protein [Mucilaginibacter daejeonensis]|uniref:protein-disulfide reductase DsbD N-terminal domain-containing protein n=1 Tax=Mucilaginibacter daejeonensis TaxID=398049 RepID=UPI001D170BBF|nr:protein-disulfide reductase DsbD N-terminal domain-containing protein [Mucilaginibacter daejeonensis]UEG53930.1 protein-disulfide reductase DsbD N-terminal domain-containing protein [Mucilaginibacter daejeonensis]
MKRIYLSLLAVFFAATTFAQIETPVKWSYAAKRISPTEAVILVKATIDAGWHIYSQNVKEGGPVATSFTFPPSKDYVLVGKPMEPKPVTKYEDAFKMNVSYFENSAIFQQRIKLKKAGATTVKGKVEYMTCNDRKCLPPDEVEFTVSLSAK